MNVQTSYNEICDSWHNFRKSTKINNCIIDFAKLLKKESKILDVGCGTGYPIAHYLTEHGFKVTGLDISEKMIKKAKELNLKNANFYVADVLTYNSSELYDAVIAFDSLWHIKKEKQREIYKKLSSLLKENGYLIFTHGNINGEKEGTMFDVNFYYSALETSLVHRLLIENNFIIIKSIENYYEETTGNHDLLIIAKKIK